MGEFTHGLYVEIKRQKVPIRKEREAEEELKKKVEVGWRGRTRTWQPHHRRWGGGCLRKEESAASSVLQLHE